MKKSDWIIPADVPKNKEAEFKKNFTAATRATGRLMLFAGDQKIEHLNDDFYGESSLGPIPGDDNDPEHLFRIASKANVGVFAAQYGLIARYGKKYPKVNYLVKMNSKSHLIKKDQRDPLSSQLMDIEDVLALKKASKLSIVGVGYTIYLGSEFENTMFSEAARLVSKAHQNGLLTVLWMYPRGKAVSDEKDPHLIAGATGVAACLGSDFVKVNYPKREGEKQEEIFKEAILAAGNCKVICAGGSSTDARKFLTDLHNQIHVSGAQGNATGRNVHQKPLAQAVSMCNAISAITLDGKDVETALKIYEKGVKQ